MRSPKVFISVPHLPEVALDLLRREGYELIMIEKIDRETVKKQIKGVDALFWGPYVRLDKEMLDAAGRQMKTVGSISSGYNHIDLDELKRRGVKLSNVPSVTDHAVADLAVLLTLAASRRLHEGRLAIENNLWRHKDKVWMLGQDLTNSTVGIIGLGGIGQAIVKRLCNFKVNEFLYAGRREKPEGKKLGAKFVDLDTLTRESDFVIVSCALTQETQGMCNKSFFDKMKKTAVFVNIARGNIVVQDALVEALRNRTIFAAGLDVVTPEPLPYNHELLDLPNLVIMPHLGNATKPAREAMAKLAANNIIRGLNKEEMLTPVV